MQQGLNRRQMLLAAGVTLAVPSMARSTETTQQQISGIPTVAPETVGMSSTGLARIDGLMADYIARNQIQGAVTAVSRHGKLVHHKTHGFFDPISKTPMQVDTLFTMMSSTKPVTAIAVLQQMELGRVRLDDPVGKFVPELATMQVLKADQPRASLFDAFKPQPQYRPDQLEPQSRRITIRDLLTHTSGLNAVVPHQSGDTLASYIPKLKETVLDFQPGSKWGYSALTGPDILARVVEITSGERFDRYLQRHIFDPVSMKDTRYNLTPAERARIVHRGARVNDAWVIVKGNDIMLPNGALLDVPIPTENSSYFNGSAGLKGTARDFLRLYTMLASKGMINGQRILRPESVTLMSSDLVPGLFHGPAGGQNGLGFGTLVGIVEDPDAANNGRPRGAFGWGGAFGTESWADPATGIATALMVQQPIGVQVAFDKAVTSSILR